MSGVATTTSNSNQFWVLVFAKGAKAAEAEAAGADFVGAEELVQKLLAPTVYGKSILFYINNCYINIFVFACQQFYYSAILAGWRGNWIKKENERSWCWIQSIQKHFS